MKWWRLKIAVLAIVVVPITYCLAVQAMFTILSAIFPFVLGFTFGIGLVSCAMAMALAHRLEE